MQDYAADTESEMSQGKGRLKSIISPYYLPVKKGTGFPVLAIVYRVYRVGQSAGVG